MADRTVRHLVLLPAARTSGADCVSWAPSSVTLVITTYNWPAALDLTLKSVARQSELPDEIIVADDGSGPETARVVDARRAVSEVPLLHVWQPDEGFRLARSRNRAIAAARGGDSAG